MIMTATSFQVGLVMMTGEMTGIIDIHMEGIWTGIIQFVGCIITYLVLDEK